MAIIQHVDQEVFYSTRLQLKIAGSIIERRCYGRDFFIGDRPKSFKQKEGSLIKYSTEELQERRYHRAKKELQDGINSNINAHLAISGKIEPPIFVTLTFAENIQDTKEANYEFTKFIQRANIYLTRTKKSYLKYVVVIEFQERGAIHYHALFFNLPYIFKSKLEDLWGNGYVSIKMVDRVKDVAKYMSKYMSKRFDDPRLRGKKCYFVSRALKKPIYVYYDSLIEEYISYLPEESIVFSAKGLPAGYMISMDLDRYNLQRYPEQRKQALAFLESTGYDGPARTPPPGVELNPLL